STDDVGDDPSAFLFGEHPRDQLVAGGVDMVDRNAGKPLHERSRKNRHGLRGQRCVKRNLSFLLCLLVKLFEGIRLSRENLSSGSNADNESQSDGPYKGRGSDRAR